MRSLTNSVQYSSLIVFAAVVECNCLKLPHTIYTCSKKHFHITNNCFILFAKKKLLL